MFENVVEKIKNKEAETKCTKKCFLSMKGLSKFWLVFFCTLYIFDSDYVIIDWNYS